MDDMFRPLRRYADFSGRASRREYWLYILLLVLLAFGVILAGMLIAIPFDSAWKAGHHIGPGGVVIFTIAAVLILALIVPTIAVQVRRLHDQDLSGWWALLNVIPYIGRLILLVLMLRSGTDGENRFGPDPFAPDEGVAEIFA